MFGPQVSLKLSASASAAQSRGKTFDEWTRSVKKNFRRNYTKRELRRAWLHAFLQGLPDWRESEHKA